MIVTVKDEERRERERERERSTTKRWKDQFV
jgi:hypothetical protein